MRYLLLSFLILAASCSSEPKADTLQKQIAAAEAQLGENPQSSDAEILALLEKYDAYAAQPDADAGRTVDYLLRGGDMAVRLKDYNRAIGYYEAILKKYPTHPKASKALFMKGFTLDNKMGKLDEAKAVYELFLEKYPDDDFANDAEFSLRNLGKSAEEIIKEFEANQKGE